MKEARISAATTAAQNQVVAVNSVARAMTYLWGQYTSNTYTGPETVQIQDGPGRLVNICIVQSGADTVQIYDSASVNALPAGNLIYVLPASTAQGVTQIGQELTDGLVMIIGSGVTANVTYSAAGTR